MSISINAIISPKISEFFSKTKYEELNLILGSSRLIFFISNIIFLLFYNLIFLKLFSLIFPETYNFSLSYSYYFILYCVFISLFYFADTVLVMTGNQKIVIYSYILAIIINFILNITLIPIFAVKGALIATIISLISFNLVNFFVLKIIIQKKTKFKKIVFFFLEGLKKEKIKIVSMYANFKK